MRYLDSSYRISESSGTSEFGYTGSAIATLGYPSNVRPMPSRKPSDAKLKAQGARVRQAIEARGKTQAEVCREVGVNANTMNRWLRGENSARAHFAQLALALGVRVEWIESGDGADMSERSEVIEDFISQTGPTLRPPLTLAEAAYVRAWPHHRVTVGALLDAVNESRRGGLSVEDAARSAEVTSIVRARGEALGVPKRRAR